MRKLYLGNGDKQFKFADTTTEIHLNAFDDGVASNLANDAKVRIKNKSGYLLEVSASITDNHAVITSGQLAQLPVGYYLIELWDTVNGGTAIYPSDGFLALQINGNVTGLSGGLVSSITVDDFIQQFSSLSEQLKQEVKVAVANGLKGDKGADGLSAYQIAVINGYQGSQTEWLASLVGEKGDKGEKGNPGKDFRIVKTFPSVSAMNGDGFSDGDFTMIASDVNDPDDGKLYVWNGTGFTYIADLSGSQGIKGDTGEKGDPGEKGKTGEQGLSAYQVAVNAGFSGSVDEWLASLVGTVDNAGLTTAPAFVNLQTQVDNSAVGTNLLTGTSSTSQTTSNIKSYSHVCQSTNGTSFTNFETGKKYTYSMNVMSSDGVIYLQAKSYSSSGTGTILAQSNNNTIYTSDTRISITITIPTDTVSLELAVVTNNWTSAGSVTIHSEKLELGSHATDWCSNPSEILTQSDYAKIKAAIVALGGSLS